MKASGAFLLFSLLACVACSSGDDATAPTTSGATQARLSGDAATCAAYAERAAKCVGRSDEARTFEALCSRQIDACEQAHGCFARVADLGCSAGEKDPTCPCP